MVRGFGSPLRVCTGHQITVQYPYSCEKHERPNARTASAMYQIAEAFFCLKYAGDYIKIHTKIIAKFLRGANGSTRG